jgi:DNA-binding transcriptional MerR regulator
VDKAPDAFRTISEAAEELDVPQHVLRFWESRFHEIKPLKRGGNRRFYRPEDVDLLRGIRHLLYGEGYTIRGVQRLLREQGAAFVRDVWQPGAPQAAAPSADDVDETALERQEREPNFGNVERRERRDETVPQVMVAPLPTPAIRTLPPDDVHKLNDVLRELDECRKLLDAVARAD